MNKPYEKKIYFGMAIDPIHVGTGGYTLGRVDNPTLRDFDGVPKIPGTSIEGTARAYASLQFNQLACASKEEHKRKCPKRNIDCPICVSFGYTDSELIDKPKSLQGLALFSDAKIMFFPVASLIGPVWITCPSKLKELEVDRNVWQDFGESESCIVSEYLASKLSNVKYLNFGWLLLKLKEDNQIITHNITSKTAFEVDGYKLKFEDRGLNLEDVFDRLVIVSNSVFSQIVNSNLEIRTSVSIDPTTGAAEEGALFNYEAIPRTTIFYFDVIYQKPEHFGLNLESSNIVETVETGFELFEFLGVGGMGTRGFGKLKIFGLDKKLSKKQLAQMQSESIVNEINELKKKLKEAKSEDKEKISMKIKINQLKEHIKQIYEEMREIASIWENANKEVQK